MPGTEPDPWSWRDWLADVFWSVAHYGYSAVTNYARVLLRRG